MAGTGSRYDRWMDSAKHRVAPVVNDFSGQNPVEVWSVVTPESTDAVVAAVRRSRGSISIGGGRYSLGGQIACANSLHLDLRQLNQVVQFSPLRRTLRVQAGIRWRDVLRFIDPHNLSVRIAQSYGNFTVGGSLSVNAHGNGAGVGPIVESVREIRLVLADGAVVDASPSCNRELFYGAIGGYGSIGIIVEAEFELTENQPLRRTVSRMALPAYIDHLRARSLKQSEAVLHHAELFGSGFSKVRTVTWHETQERVSEPGRLQLPGEGLSISGAFGSSLGNAINDNALSRLHHNYLSRPMADLHKKVHWRNFETSYDVGELMPNARASGTGTLQQYMVPLAAIEQFIERARHIIGRYHLAQVGMSLRLIGADPGTLLAWSRGDTVGVMLHYRHRRNDTTAASVPVWTRELIDAAIAAGGAHFMPYDVLATAAQFRAAYPRALEWIALKSRLDPENRFRNTLVDRYYDPTLLPDPQGALDLRLQGTITSTNLDTAAGAESVAAAHHLSASPPELPAAADPAPVSKSASVSNPLSSGPPTGFREAFNDPKLHDGFYRFLQNVYTVYPEDRFHALIHQLSRQHDSDEAVYRSLVRELPRLRPTLRRWLHALPKLAKHRLELAQQTVEFFGGRRVVHGVLDIGSHGAYLPALQRLLHLQGPVATLNEHLPRWTPSAIIERGQLWPRGLQLPLNAYEPVPTARLAPDSMDLITCYGGLHYCPPEKLDGFLASVVTLMRPGGLFVLLDHDTQSDRQQSFVRLTKAMAHAGDGMSWEQHQQRSVNLAPVSYWTAQLEAQGLQDTGFVMPQMDDPSDNVLMAFVKPV